MESFSGLRAPEACRTIDEVRAAIDAIDAEIVAAIGRRFQYVQAVTRFKQTRDDVHAVERYNAVLATRRAWALEHGLNPDVIEEMYRNLINHFIHHELTMLDLHEAHAPEGSVTAVNVHETVDRHEAE